MATNRLREDYTVAWLCALPCEMAAAEAMLDERHPELPTAKEDDNTYILGRVYSHNVVIACCRSGVYGTTSAATSATQLQATFKSVRFFLLVGIGGGAPTDKADIRLGDVVVSKPTREFGGVVQYDYGKTMSGGHFVRTGLLNKPRSVLLTALARLEAAHKATPSKIPALLSEMVERNPGMEKFTYQGKDQDVLFDSEYDHCDENDTCSGCDSQRRVTRPDRMCCEPVVHYGLIASGNQVIKNARTRDKLARELGILCFEMEAAGVMDDFQCLVARGICDYSDSHKNKQWQEYAAATAAAFAKELLSVVHAVQMVDAPLAQSNDKLDLQARSMEIRPVGELPVSNYRRWLPYRSERTTRAVIRHENDIGWHAKLVPRISDYDQNKVHRRLLRKRLVGTTQWFLDYPDYKAWFTDRTISSLWCSGKIGSGKTMIATTAVEFAMYRSSEYRSPTIFFYCESEHPGTLVDTYILSSFIKQLCEFLHLASIQLPGPILTEIRKFFGADRIEPDWIDLTHIFTLLFDLVPDSVYVIDGLDAMDHKYSKSLLELFQSLFRQSEVSERPRLLLFSRDQVPGYINIATFIPGIRRVSTSGNVMRDIELYIDTSINDKSLYRRLTNNVVLLDQVKKTLLTESSEMFLWVYLQLEILWDTCHTDAQIRSALAKLPKGLEEVYSCCIDRMTLRHSFAPRVLKWVSFAIRPLHIDELREAVSFGLEDTEWTEERMPQRDILIGCCANLVIMDDTDDCVRFAHSSVKQYLERHFVERGQANCELEYPTAERGNLECGELCITYLSFSDFSLQLRKTSTEKAAVPVPSPASLAKGTLLRHPHTSGLLSRLWPRSRGISLSLNVIRTPSLPDRTRYRFLNYAVTHWALHTKTISYESAAWERFKSLATCFNETWDFHPWASGGRSNASRLHGLFGWAVKEQHEPLLAVAQAAGESFYRICDLPLIGECLPALHVACKLGYLRITEILVDFCKVTLQDAHGYTALHYAAARGHVEICLLFLTGPFGIYDAIYQSQYTPLGLAARSGHKHVVSLFWELGASIQQSEDAASPWYALCEAARNGHYAVVSFLIDQGVFVDWRDASGQTSLSLAAGNGHDTVTELLLDKGASVDVPDTSRRTPLLWAIENKHVSIVELLLDRGANLGSRDKLGRTPLLQAVDVEHEEMVKLLLHRGAYLETRDQEHATALCYAAKRGNTKLAILLLDRGAEVNGAGSGPGIKTPLSYAVGGHDSGHEGVVRALLSRGASLD